MATWILVPAPASRLDELRACLASLGHPAARVVVVTTRPEPIRLKDVTSLAGKVLLDPEPDVRISRWWNLGLDHIATKAGDAPHEVLVTSSDCHGTPDGVAQLATALREHDLSMAGPDWHARLGLGKLERYGPADHRSVYHRVPGACFMLAGEHGLRADEAYRWWYADDDLEMQARHHSGAALVGGVDLHHGPDHELDDERQAWAAQERTRFVEKWGHEPW